MKILPYALVLFVVLLTVLPNAEAAKAKPGTFTATVSWTCTCTNQTGFIIYRKTGQTGTYAKVGATAATTTRFLDQGLKPNTLYVYQIGAVNDFNEVLGPETVATTPKPPRPKKAHKKS